LTPCLLLHPPAQTLRETFNTARYEDVMARINGRLGPAYTLDQ
jgi:hypothetical protein